MFCYVYRVDDVFSLMDFWFIILVIYVILNLVFFGDLDVYGLE